MKTQNYIILLLILGFSICIPSKALTPIQKIYLSIEKEAGTNPKINVSDTTRHRAKILSETKPDDAVVMAQFLTITAKELRRDGFVTKALKLLNQGIIYFEKNPPQDSVATRALLNLYIPYGAAHQELGLNNQALEIYFNGLTLCNKQYKDIQCHFYNNIGVVYFYNGELDKAKSFMKKAAILSDSIKANLSKFYALNNLADVYLQLNDYNKSQEYALKAIQLIDSEKQPFFYYSVQLTLAQINLFKKKFALAYSYLEEVELNQKKHHLKSELIMTYIVFADYYEAIGEDLEAISKLKEAQKICFEIDDKQHLSEILEKTASLYFSKHQNIKAYENLHLSKHIHDSITKINNEKAINNVTTMFNFKQKNQILKEKNHTLELKASHTQKINYVYLIIGLILSITLGLLLYLRKKNNQLILKLNQTLSIKDKGLFKMKEFSENQNRELITLSLSQLKIGEYICSLNKNLITIFKDLNPRDTEHKQRLKKEIKTIQNFEKNNDLKVFQYYYEQVHPHFYITLLKKYPNLTKKDLRLCALISLNMSSKEISTVTYREIRSIESARNRIRKKLDLSPNLDLTAFLKTFQ